MTTMDPSVTVIVPAYNAEAYLAATLESIAQQTLRDFRVIVVDDGSTDGTTSVVRQFMSCLNLKLVEQANAGPAAARNRAIRMAATPYCAFVDSDDVMLPERLSAQKSVLEADSRAALVHSDLMTFNETGIIHRTRRAFSTPAAGMVLEPLLRGNFITTSTVMARTERLIEAGLFSEERRVSEDFELWLRMAARWPIAYVDRPLVKYRSRQGSLSGDKLATAECALDVIETFWREHPQERHAHPQLYRSSLAEHLVTLAAAAATQGRRATALRAVTRALPLDIAASSAWRVLLKVVFPQATTLRTRLSSSAKSTA
jgi:glycosyltransferase involved in cell wall biosynthesis